MSLSYPLAKRPYFPMLMGNGNDFVLVGYTGAMGGGGSHEQWVYDHAVLTGWFKSDRRGKDHRLANLLHCGYVIKHGLRASGIDRFTQHFDTHTATLHTDCQYAHARVRVQTLLTSEHHLLHHFDVIPKAQELSLQMFIKPPSFWWCPAELSEQVTLNTTKRGRQINFTVTGDTLKNMRGKLTSDAPDATVTQTYARQPGLDIPLDQRHQFTVSLQLTDQQDQDQGTCDKRNTPLPTLQKNHKKQWKNYARQSSVKLPDNLQKIYDTSLYISRSHQHPINGGIPAGAYPLMWHSDINTFDMAFSLMAMLTANRITEAKNVLGFWKQALPAMRELAASIGCEGACIMPSVTQQGESVLPLNDDPAQRRAIVLDTKHFLTAHAPIHVWQTYLHTADINVLWDNWELMQQTMTFLLEHVVIEKREIALIIRSSGPNGKERANGKSVHHLNPTRTLLAVIEALKAIIQAADALGIEHEPCWDRLLPKLIKGIEHNRHGGIIGRNQTMPTPHADPCMAALFNAPVDRKTFRAAMKRHRSSHGNQHWEDHGYSYVPWLDLHTAATLLRLNQTDEAIVHLQRAAQCTTTLGAFPEGIRPDGVYWKTWYATVHGAFTHAMNILLARRDDKHVYVMHGVPKHWGDIAYKNLRVPIGLVINASRVGQHHQIKIKNEHKASQHFWLWVGGDQKQPLAKEQIALEPHQQIHLEL